MIELTDKQLIERYFAGDRAQFDVLVRRYLDVVHHFIRHTVGNVAEAEDLTQETFLKAWKQLKRFDTSRNFKVWIFTIARNTCIDYFRKRKATPISAFDDESGNNVLLDTLKEENEITSAEAFDNNLAKGLLSELVAKLAPAYQTVVSLRYENDLTFQEISEILGESIDTLKSRYRRALVLLKQEVGKTGRMHQK